MIPLRRAKFGSLIAKSVAKMQKVIEKYCLVRMLIALMVHPCQTHDKKITQALESNRKMTEEGRQSVSVAYQTRNDVQLSAH